MITNHPTESFISVHQRVLQLIKRDCNGIYYAELGELRFDSVFQPIVDSEREIYAFEALVRIKNTAEEVMINPGEYFNLLINNTEELLFTTTLCSMIHIRNFSQSGFRTKKIFLNTPPIVFENLSNCRDAIDLLLRALQSIGIQTEQVVYEIMELEGVDLTATLSGKENLRRNGILIAIDDYGCEFATAERVISVEPDYLKVDRSIVQQVESDDFDALLTALKLGKGANAKVIAEGVETKQTFECCKSLGIELFQGYYFEPPRMLKPK